MAREPVRLETSREKPGTARRTSRRAEPVRDHVRCPIAARGRLSDENSRENVQNVRGNSSAEFSHLTRTFCTFKREFFSTWAEGFHVGVPAKKLVHVDAIELGGFER